ncbi:DNA methylase N-4/N-6 [uncultured Caudovirales phage]|uniref:DNA methylase N-4/N-6 n=1 Tax=uncultured Caudovirales phage TaxID=2100421 RepID=A0A6J7WG49_9CAUD|nr:DNA methylase N-4/N-6 [uncultured Caudovirales phage]
MSKQLTIERPQKVVIGNCTLYNCDFRDVLPEIKSARVRGSIPEKVCAWIYNANTPRQWRGVAWFDCKPDMSLDGQDYKNPTDKRIKERIANGERARLYDWWEFQQVKNVSAEKTEHPCQMPVALLERIIKITPCDTIFEPFLGSGTTAAAAQRLGRKIIGCEIDPKYFDIACKRLESELPCEYRAEIEK